MTRLAWIGAAVVLIACRRGSGDGREVGAPEAPNSPVIVWHAGNGWTSLTLYGDGRAHYDYHPVGWGARPGDAYTADGTISPDDLRALEQTLVNEGACALTPSGRGRVPEEGDQSLTLAFGSTHCTVSLPSNDWSQTPHAQACGRALDQVMERVRTTGTRGGKDGGAEAGR